MDIIPAESARPAITKLPCGCFFSGREFFACEECDEHGDTEEDHENDE